MRWKQNRSPHGQGQERTLVCCLFSLKTQSTMKLSQIDDWISRNWEGIGFAFLLKFSVEIKCFSPGIRDMKLVKGNSNINQLGHNYINHRRPSIRAWESFIGDEAPDMNISEGFSRQKVSHVRSISISIKVIQLHFSCKTFISACFCLFRWGCEFN